MQRKTDIELPCLNMKIRLTNAEILYILHVHQVFVDAAVIVYDNEV